MWEGSREALEDLDLADRESVLDVGCGTGVLTRVLREECPGQVVGLDADPALLQAVDPPVVRGDATRLPFRDDAFDLVVCQALLINLPEPDVAVAEFARVAADAVAVVEPDNGAVTVDSTVDGEPALARRARELYLDGVETDVALGASASELLEAAGLDVVSTRRYDQVRTTAPPYSEPALADARRKATGDALADDRAEILAGEATEADYDELRQAWRSLGRDVVEQMQADEYERTETVPFFVTVGRV
jgi:SAM-dependent methyltransferase